MPGHDWSTGAGSPARYDRRRGDRAGVDDRGWSVTAFAPAAQAAGAGMLIGLAVAALVAYCNATASAQFAAAYPTSGGTYIYGTSGGTYIYGRERLDPWPGFVAGWGFVIGKTASCPAMALTFAAYAVPAGWQRPVAVIAVIS